MCVIDHIPDPTSHRAVRGICKEWRSLFQLEPPTLLFISVHPAAASSHRPFCLMTSWGAASASGLTTGWVAITYSKPKPVQWERQLYHYYRNFEEVEHVLAMMKVIRVQLQSLKDPGTKKSFPLFNPATGRRIHLPEHDRLDPSTVDKVVFAPHPRPDDYTVVVAFGWNYLAYISTRDGGAWSFSEIPAGGHRHLGLRHCLLAPPSAPLCIYRLRIMRLCLVHAA
jgi:hypothetical protein